MIGETFDSVCQIAHTLAGTLIVVLAAYFFGAPLAGVGLMLAWAIPKEFWYDLRYEPAAISGGLDGSATDFGFYCLGGGIGYGLAWLHS